MAEIKTVNLLWCLLKFEIVCIIFVFPPFIGHYKWLLGFGPRCILCETSASIELVILVQPFGSLKHLWLHVKIAAHIRYMLVCTFVAFRRQCRVLGMKNTATCSQNHLCEVMWMWIKRNGRRASNHGDATSCLYKPPRPLWWPCPSSISEAPRRRNVQDARLSRHTICELLSPLQIAWRRPGLCTKRLSLLWSVQARWMKKKKKYLNVVLGRW